MDELSQTMKGLMVGNVSTSNVDNLCEMMDGNSVEYNEVKELAYFVELEVVTDSDMKATDDRYVRYLRNIGCWTVDGISYEHIREWIYTYLNLSGDNNLLQKLELMMMIDYEFYNLVKTNLNKK